MYVPAPPPLALVTGCMDIAPVAGFGAGAGMLWLGACYGCGGRVACAADCPQPECTGCGRRRHGVIEHGGGRRFIPPVVAAILPGERRAPATTAERATLTTTGKATILRPATPLQPDDPALPGGVRRLAELAAAHGWTATLTAAVASDDRGIVASVALRVAGLGYAVYRRREDGWGFDSATVADPAVRKVNVGQLEAAIRREPYTPPEPRPPAPKGVCPGCGAEVSLTAAGAIYKNHKCKVNTVEGRS